MVSNMVWLRDRRKMDKLHYKWHSPISTNYNMQEVPDGNDQEEVPSWNNEDDMTKQIGRLLSVSLSWTTCL